MFTHLHVHTEYSLLDGVNRISPLVARIKELGMTACAITDHGNMYGVYRFYQEMTKNELKPIIGCEIYLVNGSRHGRVMGVDNKYQHLTLLAKNFDGYKNLMKIVSIGHMEGFYFKPRVDYEILERYHKGLIVLSGCLSGPLYKKLREGNEKGAREEALKLQSIYKDDFYIEIQRLGIPEQDLATEGLVKIAKELNIPLVATYDAHYLNKGEETLQEVLWAIADGKTLEDETRRKVNSKHTYIKSPEEALEEYKDIPEAVSNTKAIEEKIENYQISFGRIEPKFDELPKGKTTKEYLRELAFAGAEKLYGKVTKDLEDRLNYELDVIDDKGYNDYFLIMQMIVNYCRSEGIVVSMRGSGTASVVAFCVGITSIDPIKWELYFERFLNPERKSAPDFDLDIEDRQRDKLINYVIEKFGIDSVKRIITFSKLQTRQAIRDVSRVLGIDLSIADKLSKMVVILFGKSKSIDFMIENNSEFKEIIESSEKLKEMADIVRKIAGLSRGVSVHACGTIIAPQPVVEYVPIQRDAHNEGIGITQYEFAQLEDLGLMKFDFLGLRNLNVIGMALKKIKQAKNIDIDLIKLNFEDEKVFKLIQECRTVGVFQMEGEGMKKTIKSIKPDNIEEICYLLAAYRPGPMEFIPIYADVKNSKKEINYLLPDLEPILKITNGVITYQEQVIKIAVDIAGYSMGQADALRKAMGKKLLEVMDQEKPKFISGAINNGHDEQKVHELWDLLVKFANYGFNKAHSAMYATVAYWTAYLKTYYPLEFMAALLEGDLDKFDRVVIDLEECNTLGFNVLAPNINKSGYYFTIEGEDNIRFGMAGIKNVGKDIIKAIVSEREKNGLYLGLEDFVLRNLDNKLQNRTIEYLIMSGVLDDFGDRQAMLNLSAKVWENAKKLKSSSQLGQIDLFGQESKKKNEDYIAPVDDKKTSVSQKLHWEKELLGLYFTSHPLDPLKEFFAAKNVTQIKKAKELKPGSLVVLGCLITNVKRITTKKNERMAFLTVEDKSGIIDVIVFPRTYEEMKEQFEPNKPLLLAGRVNEKEGLISIIFEKAKFVDEEKFGLDFDGLVLSITKKHKKKDIQKLKEYIQQNPGDTKVKIIMTTEKEPKTISLRQGLNITNEGREILELFY